MKTARTIRVEVLRRVEGEGGLFVRLEGDKVVEARLNIFEPPRLFERLLIGKPLEEAPDVTARICGICPVAYQMTTVHALEAALGIESTPEIRRLRRLLYCGEWIESHTLHVHLLNAPDFLGYSSGIEMAADQPEAFQRGLRLKKHGNRLLEVLGGRAIHPVNVAVGGFYRIPERQALQALIPDFQWGLEAAIEAARWVAGFEFPDFTSDAPLVALVHDHDYPMNDGRLITPAGETIAVADYEQHFHEFQVSHSTALHSVAIDGARPYLVGPLARMAHNRQRLLPAARQIADEIPLEPGCRNPLKSILARAVEVVQAFEEALQILQDFRPFAPARIAYSHRAGCGHSATEAPRGTLYHRLECDAAGKITQAKIVPPTSQNQSQIERDLKSYLSRWVDRSDDDTAAACESFVRSYDPCISCSTHFLKTTIQRD